MDIDAQLQSLEASIRSCSLTDEASLDAYRLQFLSRKGAIQVAAKINLMLCRWLWQAPWLLAG